MILEEGDEKGDEDEHDKQTGNKRGRSQYRERRKKNSKKHQSMDMQESDANDTDAVFGAITDLDMEGFDTGLETGFDTEHDRRAQSCGSFEDVSMEKRSDHEDETANDKGGYDDGFKFEIVMKPTISDSQDEASDFSLDISEDESLQVVMGYDKELNILTVGKPALAPPDRKSGYSSEIDEVLDVDRQKKQKRRDPKKRYFICSHALLLLQILKYLKEK